MTRTCEFVLLLLATALLSPGQTVRLIEGKRGDSLVSPIPTKDKSRAAVSNGQDMPNDPLFRLQKPMFERTGMVRAWQKYGPGLLTQSVDIPVVMIDTGIDCQAPDLSGRVVVDESKTFITDGGDPCVDEYGHGTEAATIGFGNGNDGRGIAGFNWSSHIISYKVMTAVTDEFGRKTLRTSLDAVIAAFQAVRDLSARYPLLVINTSFVIDGISPTFNSLLKDLEKDGKVFLVTATDNFPVDTASLPGLPCSASDMSNNLCVGSRAQSGGLAAWSAYGGRVNYTGYCDNIIAGYPDSGYGYFTGNSGCAPQVSAAASLVAAYLVSNSKSVTASHLKEVMMRGGAFVPEMVSAIRSQEIRYPITLDMEKLFRVAEQYMSAESLQTPDVPAIMTADKMVDADGKPLLSILPGTYTVYGQGFSENTVAFLNTIPLEITCVSDTEIQVTLGPEVTFFGGYNNTLYLGQVDGGGDVDPLSIVKIASVFNTQGQ